MAAAFLFKSLCISGVRIWMLLIAAPIVPHILGRGFSGATEALRWLSLLPLLKTLHYFVSDALTGAGYQGLRTFSQVGVAVFNTLVNLWLIPAYGWRGAAWSSLASDAAARSDALDCCLLVVSRTEHAEGARGSL